MAKLGFLLLFFGIFFTVGTAIFLIASGNSDPMLESLLCQDNETFVRTSTTVRPGEQSINFFCQKNDGGELRNIGGSVTMLVFASMIPIALGIILAVIGASRSTKDYATSNAAMQQQILERFGQTGTTSFTVTSGMPRDMDSVIATVMESVNNINNAQQLTLKQKLEQLREAYDAGLISYEEFEIRKDRVLDEIAED